MPHSPKVSAADTPTRCVRSESLLYKYCARYQDPAASDPSPSRTYNALSGYADIPARYSTPPRAGVSRTAPPYILKENAVPPRSHLSLPSKALSHQTGTCGAYFRSFPYAFRSDTHPQAYQDPRTPAHSSYSEAFFPPPQMFCGTYNRCRKDPAPHPRFLLHTGLSSVHCEAVQCKPFPAPVLPARSLPPCSSSAMFHLM